MKATDPPKLHHPFFTGMSEKHLHEIAPLASTMHFPEDHFVFHEGEPANWFFLIVDGKVALQSEARHRGTIVVQTIESGEALGWSCFFEPFTWHFEARTLRPTDALIFDARRLRELCENNPRLGYELTQRVAQLLIHRLHETQVRLRNVYDSRSLDSWEPHREEAPR